MASSAPNLVVHWSFMVQCKTGQRCQSQLPGTTGSLADFLKAGD